MRFTSRRARDISTDFINPFKIQWLLYVPPVAAINSYFCAELTEIALLILTINSNLVKE